MKVNYRIVKIILEDGTVGYSVQYKNLLFWIWALTNWDFYTNGQGCDYKPFDFDSEELARGWIIKRLENTLESKTYKIIDLKTIE